MQPKRTRDKLGRYEKMKLKWKPPPDCMSLEEIRFWLTELRVHHGMGWYSLGRILGCKPKNATLRRKASGAEWIYPTEQIRFSAILKRIISGELKYVPPVPRQAAVWKLITPYVPAKCAQLVVADRPVPLVQPARFNFDLKTGKVTQRSRLEAPAPTLPSFKTLLEHPTKWKRLER